MVTTIDPITALAHPGRRGLLRGFAAAGAMAALAAPHIARGASAGRVLKMGYVYVHDSQLGAGADEFSRRVETATGGAYCIEQYPGGSLGGEVEMLDGLRKGEIDVGFISANVSANLVPEFGILELPFLFRDTAHAHAVLDSPIGQDYLTKIRERDLVALAWGELGMRHITNSKRPLREPADLRHLRLRVPQSDVMLRCFRQLGAEAGLLGFPALYAALESGRFDGQENPIATIRATHFERVQHYLTLSRHIYSAGVIFLSKDCWEDLNPTERDAFVSAARAGGLVSRQVAGQAELDGIEVLRRAGMEVVPSVDRAAFLAALEPTWSDLAQKFGEARDAQIRAFGA